MLRPALLCLFLCLLVGCSKVTLPVFDNYDAVNPIRTNRSYKKEAVRGLKTLLGRHVSNAKPLETRPIPPADIIILKKGELSVCRLYLGDDWIGFQACDSQERDWSQPIYADSLDAEDKRVIQVILRY